MTQAKKKKKKKKKSNMMGRMAQIVIAVLVTLIWMRITKRMRTAKKISEKMKPSFKSMFGPRSRSLSSLF